MIEVYIFFSFMEKILFLSWEIFFFFNFSFLIRRVWHFFCCKKRISPVFFWGGDWAPFRALWMVGERGQLPLFEWPVQNKGRPVKLPMETVGFIQGMIILGQNTYTSLFWGREYKVTHFATRSKSNCQGPIPWQQLIKSNSFEGKKKIIKNVSGSFCEQEALIEVHH